MLPKVPKGFVTNFPGAIPTFIGARQFIFLLAIVAVFLLISAFFLTEQIIESREKQANLTAFVGNYKNETELLEFPSSLWKNRFLENLDKAKNEKEPQKQFEALSANFPILMGIYNTSHDSKVRVGAEHLTQFISAEFPNFYKNDNFKIPCLDLDCGQPNYPPEITEIIEQLQDNKGINTEVRDGVLKKIQAAAISTNSKFQWQYNLEAFQAIVGEKERTNDERLAKIAEALRDFLKKNYSEDYNELEKAIPKALEI